MKRICIVTPRFITEKTGGVEIQTFLIGKYLRQFGWDVHFLVESGETDSPTRVHEGLTVHTVPRRLMYAHWRKDLIRKLETIQPAIIYQRGRSNLTSCNSVMKFAVQTKTPRVLHLAEDSDFNSTFPLKEALKGPSSFLSKLFYLPHVVLSALYFNKSLQTADIIFAQSEDQLEKLATRTGKNGFIVPSGHDPMTGESVKGFPPCVFWIAHAGRRKQPEVFVNLARTLSDTGAKFVMAGTIPDSKYRSRIEKMMAGAPNLEHVGPLDWEHSRRLFQTSAIFVNTSMSGREGFPNTYIQSWFAKTPVVTLHIDPDGIIEKNQLGFHSKTVKNLANDVRSLIENAELRKRMGEKAFDYAMTHHRAEHTTKTIDGILTDALAPKTR